MIKFYTKLILFFYAVFICIAQGNAATEISQSQGSGSTVPETSPLQGTENETRNNPEAVIENDETEEKPLPKEEKLTIENVLENLEDDNDGKSPITDEDERNNFKKATKKDDSSEEPDLSKSTESGELSETEETALKEESNSPFIVIKAFDKKMKKFDYNLPTIIKPMRGKKSLSLVEEKNTKEVYLCPEIKMNHNPELLDAVHKYNPKTKSCLFTRKYKRNQKKTCSEIPLPWLRHQEDNPVIPTDCGADKLLVFEYNDCDTVEKFISYGEEALGKVRLHKNEDQLTKFEIKKSYPMYEVCYDFSTNKTLWTRHQIMEPLLIYNPNLKQDFEDQAYLSEISNSTFQLQLNDSVFRDLKTKYQKDASGTKPELMVPMSHMALYYWKTVTRHFINTAPLQEKLRALMKAINEGIKKATLREFFATGEKLHVFTKAETNPTWMTHVFTKQYFNENIWYKFIYHKTNDEGVVIVLHNTPLPPTDQERECYADNLKCHIDEWLKEPNGVTKEDLEYAYCCLISAKRAYELFQVKVEIGSTYNMQEAIRMYEEYRQFYGENWELQFLSGSSSVELGTSKIEDNPKFNNTKVPALADTDDSIKEQNFQKVNDDSRARDSKERENVDTSQLNENETETGSKEFKSTKVDEESKNT